MSSDTKEKLKDSIELNTTNDVLLQVVDAGKGYHRKALVVVPMTHVAFIIQNGALREKLSGGSTLLYKKRGCLFSGSENKNIVSLKVIYISKTAKLTVKWGTNTTQRITYVEPTSSLDVTVGACGEMDIRIKNAEKFYLDLVAAEDAYSLETLEKRIRNIIVNETFRIIKQTLSSRRPAYTELSYIQDDIQDEVGQTLRNKYVEEFGFEVSNFIIESLNIDQESANELKNRNVEDSAFSREEAVYGREKEADRRRKRDYVEDIDIDEKIYTTELQRKREQEKYNRENRHEDEDRSWAREESTMQHEERMEGILVNTLVEAYGDDSPAKSIVRTRTGTFGRHCTVCGAAYEPNAQYCPSCGATLPRPDITVTCKKCGNKMPWGTKYCPGCGGKVEP